MARTAAIIIIGNEILSGKVKDVNSNYLARELWALGVSVQFIAVLPDDIETISRAVSDCSAMYDFVFTSGGVGPTHDDVTMEAVASAFRVGTVLNDTIAQSIISRCGELPPEAMKIAMLPEGAEAVTQGEDLKFPPVVFRNIYIFPGIPSFLQRKFKLLKDRFQSSPYLSRTVYVREDECYIVGYLEKFIREFPDVELGSYPNVDEEDYRVMLTLQSTSPERLEEALSGLLRILPSELVFRAG